MERTQSARTLPFLPQNGLLPPLKEGEASAAIEKVKKELRRMTMPLGQPPQKKKFSKIKTGSDKPVVISGGGRRNPSASSLSDMLQTNPSAIAEEAAEKVRRSLKQLQLQEGGERSSENAPPSLEEEKAPMQQPLSSSVPLQKPQPPPLPPRAGSLSAAKLEVAKQQPQIENQGPAGLGPSAANQSPNRSEESQTEKGAVSQNSQSPALPSITRPRASSATVGNRITLPPLKTKEDLINLDWPCTNFPFLRFILHSRRIVLEEATLKELIPYASLVAEAYQLEFERREIDPGFVAETPRLWIEADKVLQKHDGPNLFKIAPLLLEQLRELGKFKGEQPTPWEILWLLQEDTETIKRIIQLDWRKRGIDEEVPYCLRSLQWYNVQDIYLSGNRLKKLGSDFFPFCPRLRILSLSGNQMKEIPRAFCYYWRRLEIVDLAGNPLKKLPDDLGIRSGHSALNVYFRLHETGVESVNNLAPYLKQLPDTQLQFTLGKSPST